MPTLVGNQKPALGAAFDYSHPLARDMMLYVPFNEGAGRQVRNAASRGGVSTQATPGWSPGRFGQTCAIVDGVNSAPRFASDLGDVPSGNPVSFAAWCYPTSMTGNRALLQKRNDGLGTPTAYYFGSNATAIAAGSNYNVYNASVAYTWVLNQWVHIGMVLGPDTTRFYVNGAFYGSNGGAVGVAVNTADVFIGAAGIGGETWSDKLDDVGLWARALTAAEFAQLYAEPFCLLRRADAYRRWFVQRDLVITGTATAGITEADIVAGGKTIIATLGAGYQWPA